MTIKFEDNNGYRFLIGKAIKNEMLKLWKSTFFMCDHGYSKHYWDEQIDQLADFLIQYHNQTDW